MVAHGAAGGVDGGCSMRWRAIVVIAAAVAAAGFSHQAIAGGLAVREQSAQFQGLSFAGAAAGGGLSSSFWNSAAIGEIGNGTFSESHAAAIFGQTDYQTVTGTGFTAAAAAFPSIAPGDAETNDRPALVSSSYFAHRINDNLVFGMAVNAPFGLSNELDDPSGAYRLHHRSAKLFTLNFNPMMSYKVMPGVMVGFGVQAQYASLSFKTASAPAPVTAPNAVLDGDDVGFGITAGILLQPSQTTSIGIGYRSAIAHTISGEQLVVGTPANAFRLDVDTPDMVTVSLRQDLSNNLRVLGTLEWTNWDRLDVHPILVNGAPIGAFDFQWEDGWFFSGGIEYDVSKQLTVRGGVAYEISPIDDPTQRLPQVPDSDRVWLSVGATYAWSQSMSFDIGYSHVFLDDARLDRRPAAAAASGFRLVADTESSADIVAASVKMKW